MNSLQEAAQFITDAVLEKKVYIIYIGAEDQHADMLNRPLNTELLGRHVGALVKVG